MTDQAMSPLGRRMIEDMTIRKLAPLSYNSKPRGFYLQPGGAQNLAWWAISSIGSRTQPGGRLACWLLAKKPISTAASF